MRNKIFLGVVVWIVYLVAANLFLQSRIIFAWFKLDSNNPLYVVPIAIFINVLPVFVFFWLIGRLNKKTEEHRQFLINNGSKGVAEVISVQDTGTTINNNPLVRMVLKVQPSIGSPFETGMELTVSRLNIPRKGDMLQVVYDRQNNKDLIII